MKQTPLNCYSLKKIAELNAEAPIRIALCRRASGIPVETRQTIRRNDGSVHTIRRITCINGICEECHQRKPHLEPHEKVHRAQGGILSLDNTVMVDRGCHKKLQQGA